MKIVEILKELVQRRGSDLHLKVGRPPLMRVSSDLLPTEHETMTDESMLAVLNELIGKEGVAKLKETFEFDGAYVIPDVARFRINAFKQMDHFGTIMRVIPLTVPSIDDMKLPVVMKDICSTSQGMVLVTGPTGSGKSTSLAAMINHINETSPRHIVTIEDPVEFVYTDNMATINQRQLGTDVKSLTEALRRVLRQDPDIILMGEMRDRETIEMAMHAAETGHLVFSTLHTNDAKQTIDRIVDMFPTDGQSQIRAMLALTLRAIVSQRLVKRADGNGRVGAFEILINSPQIRELIQAGKTREIGKAIAAGGDYYRMQSFNQALAQLVRENVVEEETALAASANPNDLKLLIKGIQKSGLSMGTADTGTKKKEEPKPEVEKKFKITKGF